MCTRNSFILWHCLREQGQHWSTQVCVIMTEKIVCGKNPSHASGAKTTNQYKKYKLLHSIIYWTLQRIQLCIIYCRYDFTICKVLNMNIQTKTTARNNVKNVSLELFTLILRSCSTKNITGHLQICPKPMTVYFRNWTLSAACYRRNYTLCTEMFYYHKTLMYKMFLKNLCVCVCVCVCTCVHMCVCVSVCVRAHVCLITPSTNLEYLFWWCWLLCNMLLQTEGWRVRSSPSLTPPQPTEIHK